MSSIDERGRIASPALSSRRRLAFPFVVVLFTHLWFVVRASRIESTDRLGRLPVSSPVLVGVAVSLVVAAVAMGIVAASRRFGVESSRQLVSVFEPSNPTLVTLAVLSVAIVVYAIFSPSLALPPWVETMATVVGVVLGWPLIVTYGGFVVVTNATVGQPPFALEAVVVAIGVALSTAWLFVLSSKLGAIGSRRVGRKHVPR